jgi:hypothetical protein
MRGVYTLPGVCVYLVELKKVINRACEQDHNLLPVCMYQLDWVKENVILPHVLY